MISHARWGCWETNSSTFNQIAISGKAIIRTDGDLPNKVVLNYDFPSNEGDMIKDTTQKIRIVWALIREIHSEMKSEYNSELMKHVQSYSADVFETIFFRTLREHGIAYEVDPNVNPDEDVCVGLLGMSGVTDRPYTLFTTPGYLERFLFDKRSMFTFGKINCWAMDDELGYTGLPTTGFDILEV